MRINSFPHITEEYYCQNCDCFRNQFEVSIDWKCPKCKNHIEIRIKTGILNNSCFRIQTKELVINDMVLLDRNDEFRTVLDLKKEGDSISIALERYRAINIPKDNFILKLHGGWYHNNEEKPTGNNE